MSQFRGTTDRAQITSAAAAISADDLVALGDIAGLAADDAAIGDPVTLWTRTKAFVTDVVAEEAIAIGAEVFWHQPANVFTRLQTDAPAGYCEVAKDASDTGMTVSLLNPRRKGGVVRVPFDFGNAVFTPFGVVGAVTLRDFGADRIVHTARIVHDGNLAGGTATVALGTTGSLTSILAATAVSTFAASGIQAITLGTPGVTVTDIIMTIGVAALTAGIMVVEIEYGDGA